MGKLHDLLIEKVIAEAGANGDTEPNQDDLVERLTEFVPTFVESAAATFLNQIKKDAKLDLFVKTPRQPGARWG